MTRPAFRPHERGLLVLLARLVRAWPQAILLVRPETVLRWHREGFRLFWRWRSRRRPQPAEPRVSPSTITLIRRMADDNRLWGAERIRGELLKLGIRVAKRTVQRYMRGARPSAPHGGQRWSTFLRNHTVWACDFLQIYDIWFRPIFAFFIVDVNTRHVVHVAVTRAPTQQSAAQQLRNATPFRQGPQVLIRGRVGGRRGSVQASLVCVRRFRLRARLGLPSLRLRPPPHRTGQADFPHPAHREGVIHRGYDSVRLARAFALLREAVVAKQTPAAVHDFATPPLPAEARALAFLGRESSHLAFHRGTSLCRMLGSSCPPGSSSPSRGRWG